MALSVLMLVNQLDIGGTETHVLSLAEQLCKEGVQVTIGTAGGVLEAALSQPPFDIFHLPFESDDPVHSEYQALITQMKELVESRGINLIHAHSIAALKVAVQVSQETLLPVVATIHGKFYPPRILRAVGPLPQGDRGEQPGGHLVGQGYRLPPAADRSDSQWH